jgi:hypothetical protein
MHFIEADLSMAAPWAEDFAADGIAELEALLAKHAAFHAFLEETGRS